MTIDTILPRVELVEVPLQGEPPTDKAFIYDGVTYRVRLVSVASAALALPNVTGGVAPFLQAFDVTITRLGEDGLPVRLNNGTVVIVAQTRITLDSVSAQGGLTIRQQVDMIIGNLIHQACQVGLAQIEIEAISQDWGGGTAEPRDTTPYVPPSLPQEIAPYIPPATPEIIDVDVPDDAT